ncbi:hypothetical protein Mlaev_02407 [Microbacterium laevaniformans]|uniref:Calcineurin-like phosphoesterase domain-containing protein n=1 Tax=Microbacterium laevaniformans TaxID=36807 RepID=A0A150HBC7_9MICO|nr:hypothetical protein Mlaev_02407 [Microbacterium laevaniformans]
MATRYDKLALTYRGGVVLRAITIWLKALRDTPYVTADTHFDHARISELAERPFTTVDDMNTELVRSWNEVVSPTDVVLHLGDVALGPIEESIGLTAQLNGCRYLVPGNHDRVSPATQSRKAIERFAPLYEAAGWTILPEVIEGTRRGYRILASHYPYKGDSQESDRHTTHRPRWDDGIPLLHGHTHARDHGPIGHQFHVGVDAHGYAPIPFTVIDDVRAREAQYVGSGSTVEPADETGDPRDQRQRLVGAQSLEPLLVFVWWVAGRFETAGMLDGSEPSCAARPRGPAEKVSQGGGFLWVVVEVLLDDALRRCPEIDAVLVEVVEESLCCAADQSRPHVGPVRDPLLPDELAGACGDFPSAERCEVSRDRVGPVAEEGVEPSLEPDSTFIARLEDADVCKRVPE